MCATILKKLEKFVTENSNRIEKSSSHKFLTLLLNPLEEVIKFLGNTPESLPEECDGRISAILAKMKGIFKSNTETSKTSNPPTTLVESYIRLNLLVDKEFQSSDKLPFEKYFTLFTAVKRLLDKAPTQNALPMASLVRLCTKVTIPEADKDHFYQDFAVVVKVLLSMQEPHTFYTCLSAFMEWANQTDLPDLNFMVPNDPVVQNSLQQFMEKERIDLSLPG